MGSKLGLLTFFEFKHYFFCTIDFEYIIYILDKMEILGIYKP